MMSEARREPITRRSFVKRAAVGTASVVGAGYWLGSVRHVSGSLGKKVIVIGIDGMDPRLCAAMMREGLLPHLKKLGSTGGFRSLETSIPPQSPVAWANFINGAGPGSHGIFDFIHRRPDEPCMPFYSAAETVPGEGGWEIGEYRLPITCWPFRHRPPATVLRRQGVPFWDYLDAARIPSTFYDLPSNYPPSPSRYGYHRCISGMGTPDLMGTYGTYQHFCETASKAGPEEAGGKSSRAVFQGDSARLLLEGPENLFLKVPQRTTIELTVHRDTQANAAVLELQGRKIVLQRGQWSRWTRLDFALSTPPVLPTEHLSGICRFYLQEVAPNFRLYVTPINIDPSRPAVRLSEPAAFIEDVSQKLGLFYTTGFQEDHQALSRGVFDDDEFLRQATMVLEERLALLEYAMENYDDGLLFFYFSSSDLQSHLFWWDSEEKHPTRSGPQARKCFGHIKRLYERLDSVIGDIGDRYGGKATILVMSDHGFANFGRQFNLNSWLRDNAFLGPRDCKTLLQDVDWSGTRAYGLGINGLYLNLKGRERDGTVEPGQEQEELTRLLVARLEAVRDVGGRKVIKRVYRAGEVYSGSAMELAPDLIVGYARGYRASRETCLGELVPDVLADNTSAWSADHCADPSEVPGVLCCNRPIRVEGPSLTDLAPTILAEFGLPTPPTMCGRNLFGTQSPFG